MDFIPASHPPGEPYQNPRWKDLGLAVQPCQSSGETLDLIQELWEMWAVWTSSGTTPDQVSPELASRLFSQALAKRTPESEKILERMAATLWEYVNEDLNALYGELS